MSPNHNQTRVLVVIAVVAVAFVFIFRPFDGGVTGRATGGGGCGGDQVYDEDIGQLVRVGEDVTVQAPQNVAGDPDCRQVCDTVYDTVEHNCRDEQYNCRTERQCTFWWCTNNTTCATRRVCDQQQVPRQVNCREECEKTTVSVMSWNMACRDFSPYAGCDNCDTRFSHIAESIEGTSGYESIPDFDSLDVIIAQELFTSKERFQAITDALASKGFIYASEPAPTEGSPQCASPLQPGSVSKIGPNGGLMMWSRYEIKAFKARRWCAHAFPTHQGYTAALLDVEGRDVVVFNLHMMPEIGLGQSTITAEDLRMYQFSEVANLAKYMESKLKESGGAYSILVGGDTNEDAYHLVHLSAGTACDKVTNADVITKFNALNFDLVTKCQSGAVGTPTWDPTGNDLTEQFSATGRHLVLDYIVEYMNSGGTPSAGINTVYDLSYSSGWSGEFCNNPLKGTSSGTQTRTHQSLSDHNAVVASFDLPPAMASRPDTVSVFNNAFDEFDVQKASCGQKGAGCLTDANCCRRGGYAFDNKPYQCTKGTCEPARGLGAACNVFVQGSQCMDYDLYPGGLHCEDSICVRKYPRGHSCWQDAECDSKSCSGWWSRTCD